MTVTTAALVLDSVADFRVAVLMTDLAVAPEAVAAPEAVPAAVSKAAVPVEDLVGASKVAARAEDLAAAPGAAARVAVDAPRGEWLTACREIVFRRSSRRESAQISS